MRNDSELKHCRKCGKELPVGYKHKLCEACRNKNAHVVKKTLEVIGAGAATVAGVAVFVISGGKVNLRK